MAIPYLIWNRKCNELLQKLQVAVLYDESEEIQDLLLLNVTLLSTLSIETAESGLIKRNNTVPAKQKQLSNMQQ